MYYRNQHILNLVSRGQRLTGWFSLILGVPGRPGHFLQPLWNVALGWLADYSHHHHPLPVFVRQIFLFENVTRPEPLLKKNMKMFL